jgi:diaminopimelate decarboxylase
MSQDEYIQPMISGELGRSTSNAAVERNYYAHGNRVNALLEIDGILTSALLTKFGSPLFVFSEHKLRSKARRARDAFISRYPKTSFAWSYKTNYLNAICQILHQEGWLAEVVSDFEYQKARKLGVTGKDIVFNGPYKPRDILVQAIKEGALIQIDNWDELNLIEELVKHVKQPVDVGIRVWLDAGIKPIWSKFGFALANGEASRAATRVVRNPKLRLHTLHTHIGTYILLPDAYRVAAQKLVTLREQIHTEHAHLVECINLGGGFPSYSLLHGMNGPVEQVIPPIEAYADAITDVFNKLPAKKRPLLRLESGRHLIDEAGFLLTSVVSVKGMNRFAPTDSDLSARDYKEQLILSDFPKTSYVINAGINILYTAAWYKFSIDPSRLVEAPPQPSRIYGPLCMSIDVICDTVELPPLKVGDILVLHPVGAYNFSQSMQFIDYRPAVVLINEKGKPELIRKREVLEDIEKPERLPKHLVKK